MKEIPVTIISGFLGSGKTTAVIKLLGQKTTDEQWAVIINEFGKISVDSQTVRSSSSAGTVFEVSGGCICCSAKAYFQENLERIIVSGNYQRIVIEPSGLGGIEMVSEIVKAKPELKLMPTICMVDITALENPRLQINYLYKAQILVADLIVFSKCDLLSGTEVQDQQVKLFKSLFPEKKHFLSGSFLTPIVLSPGFSDVYSESASPFIFYGKPLLTDANYREFSLQYRAQTVFDSEKMVGFFDAHPSLIRAKGYFRTEMGWNLFNYTLSGCFFEPCPEKEQNEIIFIAEESDTELMRIVGEFKKIFSE